jgi:hypothetical protein
MFVASVIGAVLVVLVVFVVFAFERVGIVVFDYIRDGALVRRRILHRLRWRLVSWCFWGFVVWLAAASFEDV